MFVVKNGTLLGMEEAVISPSLVGLSKVSSKSPKAYVSQTSLMSSLRFGRRFNKILLRTGLLHLGVGSVCPTRWYAESSEEGDSLHSLRQTLVYLASWFDNCVLLAHVSVVSKNYSISRFRRVNLRGKALPEFFEASAGFSLRIPRGSVGSCTGFSKVVFLKISS